MLIPTLVMNATTATTTVYVTQSNDPWALVATVFTFTITWQDTFNN